MRPSAGPRKPAFATFRLPIRIRSRCLIDPTLLMSNCSAIASFESRTGLREYVRSTLSDLSSRENKSMMLEIDYLSKCSGAAAGARDFLLPGS